MSKDNIVVSDDFLFLYENINVLENLGDKIEHLDEREFYLFIIVICDSHDMDNSTLVRNMSRFKKEIYDVIHKLEGQSVNNSVLDKLYSDLGDAIFIFSGNLRHKSGKELPKPLSKQEVRNIKIKEILNKNN